MMARLDEHEVLFIDALRGLLALGVLITHSIDLGIAGVYGWDLTANPYPWNLLRVVAGHGGAFVWGFFVISGVCIQQSILRSLDAGSFTFSNSSIVLFLASREEMFRCNLIASITWPPQVNTGFSELIGSWNIMPIPPPLMLRSAS